MIEHQQKQAEHANHSWDVGIIKTRNAQSEPEHCQIGLIAACTSNEV